MMYSLSILAVSLSWLTCNDYNGSSLLPILSFIAFQSILFSVFGFIFVGKKKVLVFYFKNSVFYIESLENTDGRKKE